MSRALARRLSFSWGILLMLLAGHPLTSQEGGSGSQLTDEDLGELANFLYQEDILDEPGDETGLAQAEIDHTKIRIFKVSPAFHFHDRVEDEWSLRLKVQLSFGLRDFDDFILGEQERLSAQSVAVVPEVQITFPLSKNWKLKPFADLGAGYDLEGDETVWIGSAGLRVTKEWPRARRTFGLVGSVKYSRSDSTGGTYDDDFAYVDAGPRWRIPMGIRVGGERGLESAVQFKVRYYFRELTIREPGGRAIEIDERYEIAYRIGVLPSLEIWKIKIHGIKLSYAFGDDFSEFKVGFGKL